MTTYRVGATWSGTCNPATGRPEFDVFPVKERWNYKKEVRSEEWYRDAMRQIVE